MTYMQEVLDIKYAGATSWGAFGLFIACIPEELVWKYRVVFTGMTVSKKRDRTLLVLKGTRRGEHVVAFVDGRDLVDCMRRTWTLMNYETLRWKPDRYTVAG